MLQNHVCKPKLQTSSEVGLAQLQELLTQSAFETKSRGGPVSGIPFNLVSRLHSYANARDSTGKQSLVAMQAPSLSGDRKQACPGSSFLLVVVQELLLTAYCVGYCG